MSGQQLGPARCWRTVGGTGVIKGVMSLTMCAANGVRNGEEDKEQMRLWAVPLTVKIVSHIHCCHSLHPGSP